MARRQRRGNDNAVVNFGVIPCSKCEPSLRTVRTRVRILRRAAMSRTVRRAATPNPKCKLRTAFGPSPLDGDRPAVLPASVLGRERPLSIVTRRGHDGIINLIANFLRLETNRAKTSPS